MPTLARDLARRDLTAIGLVLVPPGTRRTVTMWRNPDTDPHPLEETATAHGHDPAALILVFAREASVYVREEWQGLRWLTRYVDHVAAEIGAAGGLATFLATQTTLGCSAELGADAGLVAAHSN